MTPRTLFQRSGEYFKSRGEFSTSDFDRVFFFMYFDFKKKIGEGFNVNYRKNFC